MNKKSRIYIIVLIWAAAMLQLFINAAINREEKMIEQAMSESVSNIMESVVKAYAYYGNQEISNEGRELIAKNLANELGITSGYEIVTRKEGENITTALEKKGAYGDTTVKVISLWERDEYNQEIIENYIMVEICLKGKASASAEVYKEKLEEMYTGLGMKPSTNVYLCSQKPGQLTEGEIQLETSAFLEEMGAVSVQTVEFDGVISTYGYSNGISEFVYQGDDRVNVNIAFTYDEENDVTYIHRAIPFIDKSF